MDEPKNEPGRTPYDLLGGAEAVRALAERFYDLMEQHEPALAAIHHRDENGKISRGSRDRFALFLIGWLGGPQEYIARHGHPRLRMRHGAVRVNSASRDAWLRAMGRALDARGVDGPVRTFLDTRFAEVADFLRNSPDERAQGGDGR
jgi:hemoglobin